MRLQSARCLLLGTQQDVSAHSFCPVKCISMLLSLSLTHTHTHTQHISYLQQVSLSGWEDVATSWPDSKLAVKSFPLLVSPPQVPTVHTWCIFRTDTSALSAATCTGSETAPSSHIRRVCYSLMQSVNQQQMHGTPFLSCAFSSYSTSQAVAQLHYSLHNFAPK